MERWPLELAWRPGSQAGLDPEEPAGGPGRGARVARAFLLTRQLDEFRSEARLDTRATTVHRVTSLASPTR